MYLSFIICKAKLLYTPGINYCMAFFPFLSLNPQVLVMDMYGAIMKQILRHRLSMVVTIASCSPD
jgi:hypothetical protein